MRISTCTSAKYYINNANPIVITNGTTGPQVIKKVGVVCEDSSGNPTSTGSAYFEVAGASPLVVEYKLLSEPDTAIQLFNSNAPSTFEIPGLIPNETYQVLITSCGTTIRTNVIIQTPGVLTATNTLHPCVNNPYTLSAPDYVGATYEWTNQAGTVVSTTKDYYIANYNAANDGVYTAKISWGGCVVRFITITIDSKKCGQPIDEVCVNPAKSGTPDGFTKVGITVQSKQESWPENIPNGFIALESQEKGFVITRVNHVSTTPDLTKDSIKNPIRGMMIYDIEDQCVKLFNGEKWSCIKRSCNTATTK